ncbi:MAG: type I asparaginase [Dysgonamonadaceae bacterium]|nr:type I asparaginase [Dysgonamonadaceae bacterium]
MIDNEANVLLIYTGGTIGMAENPETGALEPFNFTHLRSNVPEMQRLKFNIETYLFDPPLDSSEMTPDKWKEIVKVIENGYGRYDGFVVLHGTDTMSFTASALSFMMKNLKKPVIFTGSQLPIGKLRTDGKENLITALEIAADKDEAGCPIAPEVCIYFQNYLLRGNRTTKINADNFNAFNSGNYPSMAEAGIKIRYDKKTIIVPDYSQPTTFYYNLDCNVAVLKLFPGIQKEAVAAVFDIPHLKGVVLETYGSGNALRDDWFIACLKHAIGKGVLVVNVSQCFYGSVEMMRYETGRHLARIGVVSGYDITTEAALGKLMVLFGEGLPTDEVKHLMQEPLRGELTVRS